MKHIKIIIILVFLILPFALFAPTDALAQDAGFTAVEPIPGLSDADTVGDSVDIDNYLERLFVIFLVIAIILAVIRLMICGIQYMTSEAVSSKAAAKTCIQYVVGGLLLALTSYIILATVNQGLLGSSFAQLSGRIDVGNVEELSTNVTLDGRELTPSDPFQANWEYTIDSVCEGTSIPRTATTKSECLDDQEELLDFPRWTTSINCQTLDSEGNALLVMKGAGFGCGGVIEEIIPPSDDWIDVGKNDDCLRRRDEIREERAFQAPSACMPIDG